MSYDGRGVGLANATNTNTDTSARVHTTARICVGVYNSLADPTFVKRHPVEFQAIKEEIALGLARPFDPLGLSYADQRGLSPVFTNTFVLNAPDGEAAQDDVMRWYIRYYDCRSKDERLQQCATACVVKGQAYYPSEVYFAGIVMCEAQADPSNGDTAVTLMIGGKITIPNGRYSVRTNDVIMWYFEEEAAAQMFDEHGMRVRRPASDARPLEYTAPLSNRQRIIRDITYAERAQHKHRVAIKPYRVGIDRLGATYTDRSRIIGIACSNAGPLERVDIKLSRMSH